MTDQAQRPAVADNHLLVCVIGQQTSSLLVRVSRRVTESGCNLLEARGGMMGSDFALVALAAGTWDAIAKLENALTRLEREDGLTILQRRTNGREPSPSHLPYMVEVIAADRPGVIHQIAEFFVRRGIIVDSLHCSRYRANLTGAEMLSAQITIGIPSSLHIASLRDDFLEFCDGLNLDAILDPVKN